MKSIEGTTAYWLIAFMTVLFMVPHSMAPWGNGNYPTDIGVYMRCAEWIQDGLVMYRDMFDHKGPLVYLIYWLFSLPGPEGVWLLDMIILFLSLLIIYQMARLFMVNSDALMVTTLIALFMQLPFTDEGGPEWIAMPGCIYGCYVLAKRLKDNDFCSLRDIILFSAAVAVCLLTKPNTSAGLIPIALYILWHLIRNFEWRTLARYSAGVIVGLMIIFIPVLCWLIHEGNIQEFIEAYWNFNTNSYGPMTTQKKIMGIVYITLVCLPAYWLFAMYLRSARTRRKEVLFVTFLFLFSLILNAYLKNGYPHYVFPCMAVFAFLLVLSWQTVKANKILRLTTISLFLLVGIIVWGVRAYLRLMPFDTSTDKQTALFINSNTDEDDYVMVCDIDDRSRWSSTNPSYSFTYRLWLLLDAKPASPYFYLPPSMTPAMRTRSWQLITARMPRFVVCTEDHKQDFMKLGYTLQQDIQNDFYILQRP